MLILLDESGDIGRRLGKGSSDYFVISLVIFSDRKEAERCDRAIDELRKELGLPRKHEFHFSNNKDSLRVAFLKRVRPYNFQVVTATADKANLVNLEGLYEYACSQILGSISDRLDKVTLIVDRRGSATLQSRLKKYIRATPSLKGQFKKIKSQDSRKNNLLQLADYCAGITNRKQIQKKDWEKYYKYISSKEIN